MVHRRLTSQYVWQVFANHRTMSGVVRQNEIVALKMLHVQYIKKLVHTDV